MPRHHVNRVRAFHILHPGDHLEQDNRKFHLNWEWFAAYLYVAGGLFLIIGSVLFLPQYADYAADGSYMFVVASILYLWVSLHDLAEIFKATTFLKPVKTTMADLMEVAAGISYAAGAALFIVGSILFLPTIAIELPAAACFISGSCLFVVGACVNVIQTYESPNKIALQYANLEAMVFVAGSCVYVCASVPYIYDFEVDADATEIFEMVAILYIWGSVLFLLGGIINIFRLLSVHDHHMKSFIEMEPLNGNIHARKEDEEEQIQELEDGDSSTTTREQPPSTPSTLAESIMKGKLTRVPSAEDLIFGIDSKESMEYSIVQDERTA